MRIVAAVILAIALSSVFWLYEFRGYGPSLIRIETPQGVFALSAQDCKTLGYDQAIEQDRAPVPTAPTITATPNSVFMCRKANQ